MTTPTPIAPQGATSTPPPPSRTVATPLSLTLPPGIVGTPSLQRGAIVAQSALSTLDIGMLDGPPGTGKTQTAEIIAACAGVDVVTVTMPYRPAPHALLRLVIQGFTGDIPDGMQAHLINDAIACLRNWGGLLIVDEVQNAGTPGIQTLRHLHDDSRCKFAMLLVG